MVFIAEREYSQDRWGVYILHAGMSSLKMFYVNCDLRGKRALATMIVLGWVVVVGWQKGGEGKVSLPFSLAEMTSFL